MKYPGVQEGAYLDFQKAISLIPKKIPPEYTTPGGSLKDLSNCRKPLKINDFRDFCFMPLPQIGAIMGLAQRRGEMLKRGQLQKGGQLQKNGQVQPHVAISIRAN